MYIYIADASGARQAALQIINLNVSEWCGARDNNYFTEMCSGSEAGSYLRLIDLMYHSTLGNPTGGAADHQPERVGVVWGQGGKAVLERLVLLLPRGQVKSV